MRGRAATFTPRKLQNRAPISSVLWCTSGGLYQEEVSRNCQEFYSLLDKIESGEQIPLTVTRYGELLMLDPAVGVNKYAFLAYSQLRCSFVPVSYAAPTEALAKWRRSIEAVRKLPGLSANGLFTLDRSLSLEEEEPYPEWEDERYRAGGEEYEEEDQR